MGEVPGSAVLTTNPTLEGLIRSYQRTPVNWDILMDSFTRYSSQYRLKYNPSSLSGNVAEYHLFRLIQRASRSVSSVVPAPIPNHARTKHFSFERGHFDGYRFSSLKNSRPLAEVDNICLVDGLPVLWELKTGDSNATSARHNDMLREERVSRITDPVREYFRVDQLAYVVVLSSNLYNEGAPSQWQFKERGGTIIPAPFTGKEHARRIIPLGRAYGLL